MSDTTTWGPPTGDTGPDEPWLVRVGWSNVPSGIFDLVFLADESAWASQAPGTVWEIGGDGFLLVFDQGLGAASSWPDLLPGFGGDALLWVSANQDLAALSTDLQWSAPYLSWLLESGAPFAETCCYHTLARDGEGRIFVGSLAYDTVWRLDPDGVARRMAGLGQSSVLTPYNEGYSGDGGPAVEADIDFGEGSMKEGQIAVIDHWLYLADPQHNAVRRVDLDTGIIDRFAGIVAPEPDPEQIGVEGLDRLDTVLQHPVDVEVGPDGAVYVSERYCVRRIDETDVVETVAGICGYTEGRGSPDGPARETPLNWIEGIAFDAAGVLYIVDPPGIWQLVVPE